MNDDKSRKPFIWCTQTQVLSSMVICWHWINAMSQLKALHTNAVEMAKFQFLQTISPLPTTVHIKSIWASSGFSTMKYNPWHFHLTSWLTLPCHTAECTLHQANENQMSLKVQVINDHTHMFILIAYGHLHLFKSIKKAEHKTRRKCWRKKGKRKEKSHNKWVHRMKMTKNWKCTKVIFAQNGNFTEP